MTCDSPFDASGKWYRGNLHAHTTNSDGWLSPAELCQSYKAAGYHFMAITDHDKVTDVAPLNEPGFLVLPGAEYGAGGPEVGSYHIAAVNIAGPLTLPDNATVGQLIQAVAAAGGVAILAHPYWSCLGTTDLLGAEACLALEAFNSGCEVEVGRGISSVHWDDMLSRGRRIFAVASDDAHHPTPGGFLSGWTMVKAEALTCEAIMEALRRGRFYCSAGPEFHEVRIAGGEVIVRCSPVRTIALFSSPCGKGNYKAAPAGESVAEARFPVPNGPYVRVQVTDALGQLAWSNPFFLDSQK